MLFLFPFLLLFSFFSFSFSFSPGGFVVFFLSLFISLFLPTDWRVVVTWAGFLGMRGNRGVLQ